MPWRRTWQPTSVFLPGEFHGQRSLEGYSYWGRSQRVRHDWATNTHTVLHSGCINVYSHQQCRRAHFSPHLSQHLLFVDFFFLISQFICRFLMVVLNSIRWYLIVTFVCITSKISEIEHLFIHLLAICMSSFDTCLFSSSVYSVLFKLYDYLNYSHLILLKHYPHVE